MREGQGPDTPPQRQLLAKLLGCPRQLGPMPGLGAQPGRQGGSRSCGRRHAGSAPTHLWAVGTGAHRAAGVGAPDPLSMGTTADAHHTLGHSKDTGHRPRSHLGQSHERPRCPGQDPFLLCLARQGPPWGDPLPGLQAQHGPPCPRKASSCGGWDWSQGCASRKTDNLS